MAMYSADIIPGLAVFVTQVADRVGPGRKGPHPCYGHATQPSADEDPTSSEPAIVVSLDTIHSVVVAYAAVSNGIEVRRDRSVARRR